MITKGMEVLTAKIEAIRDQVITNKKNIDKNASDILQVENNLADKLQFKIIDDVNKVITRTPQITLQQIVEAMPVKSILIFETETTTSEINAITAITGNTASTCVIIKVRAARNIIMITHDRGNKTFIGSYHPVSGVMIKEVTPTVNTTTISLTSGHTFQSDNLNKIYKNMQTNQVTLIFTINGTFNRIWKLLATITSEYRPPKTMFVECTSGVTRALLRVQSNGEIYAWADSDSINQVRGTGVWYTF